MGWQSLSTIIKYQVTYSVTVIFLPSYVHFYKRAFHR